MFRQKQVDAIKAQEAKTPVSNQVKAARKKAMSDLEMMRKINNEKLVEKSIRRQGEVSQVYFNRVKRP